MRIALGIEYAGTAFTGWQSQPDGRGVQDALERALAAIAGEPTRATAAGRTDAGVHAALQIVHFDTEVARPVGAWVRGTNAHLPPEIAVQWAQPVADGFHARFAATARHYTYLLANRPVRPAILAGRIGWYHRPLDVAAMREGAAALVGTHDFSAFRAAMCQARSPVKTLAAGRCRGGGRVHPFRFFRQRLPPPHDPQHRRRADSSRRGQGAARVDRRAAGRPRSHARRGDVRGRRALLHRRRLRRQWRLPATRSSVVLPLPLRR